MSDKKCEQFVQALSNPQYIHHLATQKLLDEPSFVAYLHYLQYFRRPEYLKFLL
jgi:mediator of RNA polymerase II transcription subunit 31